MSETKAENPSVITAPVESTPPSSPASSPSMKDGEEPIELLLELASYDLLTLYNRNVIKIMEAVDENGEPLLAVIFPKATWQNGIVLQSA